MARGHAEAVMPLIARVMDAARCEFAELDRIAVTVGPGSFTGLRVGISAARGIALAAGKPAVGLSTLSALRGAARRGALRLRDHPAIDARNEQVYFQVFAPNGATLVGAAARSRARGGARRSGRRGRDRRLRGGACRRALAERVAGAAAGRHSGRARHRLGRAARRGRAGSRARRRSRSICAARTRARRKAAACRGDDRLADPAVRARAEPLLSTASPRDAVSLAALHAASFNRGWSEHEFEQLLTDRSVIADRATSGRTNVGFILSRRAADEAEILSVAVARVLAAGAGLRAGCSICICGGSPGSACARCFSKWTRTTQPARRLYARAGFREVGRRPGYYAQPGRRATGALVLRRDLA